MKTRTTFFKVNLPTFGIFALKGINIIIFVMDFGVRYGKLQIIKQLSQNIYDSITIQHKVRSLNDTKQN